jgi:hypothetical protein
MPSSTSRRRRATHLKNRKILGEEKSQAGAKRHRVSFSRVGERRMASQLAFVCEQRSGAVF